MHCAISKLGKVLLACVAFVSERSSPAQTFTDPGFESAAVSAGGFVKPGSGSWLFGNDAGIVQPYSPNTSTGPLNTWSASFAPLEGVQYASTYAGGDTIRQPVTFSASGTYRLSVYAAAPTGSVTIPSVGTFPLVDGEFTLTLNNVAIGSPNTIAPGSNWSSYDALFTLAAPGTYDLGIRNTKAASYFVNYDVFEVQAIPEPACALLLGSIVCLFSNGRRLSSRKFGHSHARKL